MSKNPSQKWTPTINDNMTPAETAVNARLLWNTVNQHDQAIESLYSQMSSSSSSSVSSSSSSSSTPASEGVTSFNSKTGSITYFQFLGTVNDQSGATAYSAVDGDCGGMVVLNSSSAVAVVLPNAALTAPWFATFVNLGSSSVTFSPSTVTINGASSFVLLPSATTTIFYNSSEFYASIQLPLATTSNAGAVEPDGSTIKVSSGVISVPTATYTTLGIVKAIAQVSHEWINSIDATGAPQLSQPEVSDILGLSADLALLAPLASPALTGTPTAPTAAAGASTTQIATTSFVHSAMSSLTSSLPVYANNAAAITGGLSAGNLYRSGADPDVVCVVH